MPVLQNAKGVVASVWDKRASYKMLLAHPKPCSVWDGRACRKQLMNISSVRPPADAEGHAVGRRGEEA
jgi:hypothetical protein